MPKVTFQPLNLTFNVKDGESILDVAIEHDVPLQHACGGFCACTTCHVRVVSGATSLSDAEDEELDRLDRVGSPEDGSRLGCQARIHGDVVVEIVNIDNM
jgi:2Fe-2S ferredoxin